MFHSFIENGKRFFKIIVEICKQLKESTNGGKIVPMINVFQQRKQGGKDVLRVWNGQLISFAGYPCPNDPKSVIGDRANVAFTQVYIDS